MAIIQLEGQLSIDQTLDIIKTKLPQLAMSLECVDEGYIKGDSIAYLIVFEKYYMRVKNKVSLSIMLSEVNHQTQIIAIGSGAGLGVLSFDWGSEDDFVMEFSRLMENHNFIQI